MCPAGFTCCAVTALYFADRLSVRPVASGECDGHPSGLSNVPLTVHWLVSRQTQQLFPTNHDASKAGEESADTPRSFVKVRSYPAGRDPAHDCHPEDPSVLQWVGVNGRCNKVGDTCYAYWVCTPLKTLDQMHLVDREPIRRWLLDHTQHMVGGFGKLPRDPPDILHSYLGLATLAMFGEEGLKSLHAPLCVSEDVKQSFGRLEWRQSLVKSAPSATAKPRE